MKLETIKELFDLFDSLEQRGALDWWYETDTTVGIMVGSTAYYITLI